MERCWNGALPVNSIALARAAGVSVTPGRVAGQFASYQRLDGQAVITFDDRESEIRRRFVVAHALGHHLLGHGTVPPETQSTLASNSACRRERAANQFALAMLVPEEILRFVFSTKR
jgi:Zn-dependent peptidase ImmA (M78 family)